MPPLLAAALAGTVIGGVTISATAASVIAYGITAIASIGAQFALNKLTSRKNKKGDPQLTAITIKQAIPVRTRAYGICKLGGALFYEDAIPLQFQPLVMGIIHCEGPVDGIIGYYLNESVTGISGFSGINLALPWAYYISVEGRAGTDTQTVNGLLSSRGFTGTLKGLCYSVMRCDQPYRPDRNFQYYFPNGIPTLRALLRTSKVYDPRDGGQVWATPSTWTFSRNTALIIMDFLTYYRMDAGGRQIPRGMGIPRSKINTASFAAFATLCDETVSSAYSINAADGSVIATPRNEPRYQCDGSYQMDEAPTDVLSRMLLTCDGTLYTDGDGLVCIRGGKWEEPTVLINDDMIISCELAAGNGKFEKFNRLKISFTATNMDYQVVEGHPLDDDADIAAFGVLSDELHVPMVQSYSQARRLAKIAMAKGNPEWHYGSLICTLAAMNVIGEQFVRVIHSLPGIDGPFLVHNVKLMLEKGQVELQLSSIDPTAYDWNPATDDATPPSPQGGTG
jgi:hypothetical protein